MWNLQQNRCSVVPRGFCNGVADDGETRHIVAIILDTLGNNLNAILHGRLLAGDCSDSRLVSGELSGGRSAGDFDQPGMRHVAAEPLAALRQGLRLAVNLDDFAAGTACQQVMVDADLHFTANADRQPGEHVERVDNASVRAVLDRDDAELDMAAVDLFEHCGNRANRD